MAGSAAVFRGVEVDRASPVLDLVACRCLGRLHQKVLELLDGHGLVDLSRAVLDSAHVRAKKGANLQVRAPWTGVSPVPRCMSCPTRQDCPYASDSPRPTPTTARPWKPMLSHFHMGHESHAADSKPQRLHADKAYDIPELRKWLWGKRIGVRIARKGIESSERLGRRRWVIERTMSWLTGYRKLNHRYERKPGNYLAFLGLAAALCCYKRFLKLTM